MKHLLSDGDCYHLWSKNLNYCPTKEMEEKVFYPLQHWMILYISGSVTSSNILSYEETSPEMDIMSGCLETENYDKWNIKWELLTHLVAHRPASTFLWHNEEVVDATGLRVSCRLWSHDSVFCLHSLFRPFLLLLRINQHFGNPTIQSLLGFVIAFFVISVLGIQLAGGGRYKSARLPSHWPQLETLYQHL